MKPRAVIFDIYETLLAVKPPPADTEARWIAFWDAIPGAKRRMGLDEFSAAIREIIKREHAAARASGVAYPEIFWPRILEEAVPELATLPAKKRDELLWQQAQFLHTVGLMPGAGDALLLLQAQGVILGIASNSQPYTLREIDSALATVGLSRNLFDPNFCFYSFEHGFSKPDPAVFQFLSKKLEAKKIAPGETMMVGNRLDNDVLPAKSLGWQTWHFSDAAAVQPGMEGNWQQFCQWFV